MCVSPTELFVAAVSEVAAMARPPPTVLDVVGDILMIRGDCGEARAMDIDRPPRDEAPASSTPISSKRPLGDLEQKRPLKPRREEAWWSNADILAYVKAVCKKGEATNERMFATLTNRADESGEMLAMLETKFDNSELVGGGIDEGRQGVAWTRSKQTSQAR